MSSAKPPVLTDAWNALRAATSARIALGRAGASLPTRALLDFGLAHAQARDAVHAPLDVPALRAQLEADGWSVREVRSRAADRVAYLARPDWGRRLHPDALTILGSPDAAAGGIRDGEIQDSAALHPGCDLAFVLSDGLSATAVQNHAAPLLCAVRLHLPGLRLAPIVIATQARVALADEVGELLGARIAISMIGERPGLSASDSLGLYLTWAPRVGRSDAERNCISNVRPQGLGYAAAAEQLAALVCAALSQGQSGVRLNLDSGRALPTL